MSAAPGTGTAIPARASIRRAGPTAIPSPRSCCRSGSGPSISPPSPTRCATSTTWPTSSICAGTSGSAAASSPRTSTRRSDRWTITLESGEQASARLLITALGPLSAPTLPNIPGRDSFHGPGLPHLALAARGRVARRQARRHHRHRRHRHPGHPDHRRRGRPSHGVPAHAQLGGALAQPAHHPRGAEEDQGAPTARSSSAAGRPAPASSTRPTRARRWRSRPRSARRSGRSSMASRASASGSATSPTC